MAYELLYHDVDITNGGVWVDDQGDYANVLEVTDLDSATGQPGMVLVQRTSVGFYTRSTTEAVQRLRNAYNAIGWAQKLPDRAARRRQAWYCMATYGYGDVESEDVVRYDADEPAVDGWRPTQEVAGEAGLRQWLEDEWGLPFLQEATGAV